MKIDTTELRKKRRHNVQEQLALKKEVILNEAQYWRKNGIPSPLKSLIEQKGIDMDNAIILYYSQDFPGINTDVGLILTSDLHFYKFEVDLTPDRTQLISCDVFENVSHKYEVCAHKKGIGKTYGYLAIEVLKQLNENEP